MRHVEPSTSGTRLGMSTGAVVGIVCFLALLGAGLGLLLPRIVDWLLGLSWVPFRGPLSLVNSVPDAVAGPGLVVLGVVAGAVLGMAIVNDEMQLTVNRSAIRLKRGQSDRTISREIVGAVFKDGKDLVVQGVEGNDVAREQTDLSAARLGRAFGEHGYPWTDGDPHTEAYRLWTEQSVGLPPGAAAILRARARALTKARADEAREYRRELNVLGVVVRDDGGKQYWRLGGSPPSIG